MEPKTIDLKKIVKLLYGSKMLYVKVLPVVFVLSSLFIICIPRYYTCTVKLAPESTRAASGGSLSALASSFGINLASKALGADAISPELYPDLMKSTDFVVGLMNINVKSGDGKVNTTLYDYLRTKQKAAWWNSALGYVLDMFADADPSAAVVPESINSFRLSKTQMDMVKVISGNIKCSVDKKTDVITIEVTDQNALICATLADSVKVHLQKAITEYRTNKARLDLAYTKKLYAESKQAYEQARYKYAEFADANNDAVLKSVTSLMEDYENEMQLKYNVYSMVSTQLQAAKAKVQETTPAFTTLQSATVPQKPAGPKRVFFVLGCLVLATFITSARIIYKHSSEL